MPVFVRSAVEPGLIELTRRRLVLLRITRGCRAIGRTAREPAPSSRWSRSPDSATQPAHPRRVSRRCSQAVGKGAYGVVCSCRDTTTGRKVAVKKVGDAFNDETDAKRTLREIKLLRFLNHDNVRRRSLCASVLR